MKLARLKAPKDLNVTYYHCISRVVEKHFALGAGEKEEFVRLMRLYEKYCGIRVETYCVMSNRFHLMLKIPQKPEGFILSDKALLERLKPVVSPFVLGTVGPGSYRMLTYGRG